MADQKLTPPPSTEDSDSEISVHAPDHQGSSRVYEVLKTAFQRHYEVRSKDGTFSGYAPISGFTPGKPDVTLHAGKDSRGPVIAVAHFPKFSYNFKVGLGDPDKNAEWEDVTGQGPRHLGYRWAVPKKPDSRAYGKTFVWKRTRSEGVGETSPSAWSLRNYKLEDEATKEVVAVFTGNHTLHKCGDLEIRGEYGEDFDTMVFITCLALNERARRRRHRSSAGGAAGS
jgi:hypothetical protein